MTNFVATTLVIPDIGPYAWFGLAGSSAIDATGEKFAFVGPVWNKDRATKNITKVGFRFGSVTKAGGSGLTVSLQNVDTANGPPGQPDGTQDQTVAIANGNAAFASNTWMQTGALSATRSVAFGELLAVVIEFDGGGRLGADSVQIQSAQVPYSGAAPGSSHSLIYTASWAVQYCANVVLEFDDGTFGTLGLISSPVDTYEASNFNSGSTPDEYALRFSLPFQCKCDGAWVQAAPNANTGNFDVVLYEGTTAVATVSVDANTGNAAGATTRVHQVFFPEVTLKKDTVYYLSLKPTTTNAVWYRNITVNAAGHFQAHYGGTDWTYATRTDAGAWTETTTKRFLAGIYVSAIDIRSPSELINSAGVIG